MDKVNVKRKPQHSNHLQACYLRDRLESAAREVFHRNIDGQKEPATIKQARKMVDAWDRAESAFMRTQRQARDKRVRLAQSKAREAILFAAPADALKAVQDFEREFGAA